MRVLKNIIESIVCYISLLIVVIIMIFYLILISQIVPWGGETRFLADEYISNINKINNKKQK